MGLGAADAPARERARTNARLPRDVRKGYLILRRVNDVFAPPHIEKFSGPRRSHVPRDEARDPHAVVLVDGTRNPVLDEPVAHVVGVLLLHVLDRLLTSVPDRAHVLVVHGRIDLGLERPPAEFVAKHERGIAEGAQHPLRAHGIGDFDGAVEPHDDVVRRQFGDAVEVEFEELGPIEGVAVVPEGIDLAGVGRRVEGVIDAVLVQVGVDDLPRAIVRLRGVGEDDEIARNALGRRLFARLLVPARDAGHEAHARNRHFVLVPYIKARPRDARTKRAARERSGAPRAGPRTRS